MNKKRKFISIILILNMTFLLVLAACKDNNDENPDNSTANDTNIIEMETQSYLETLPTDDFAGYNFKIIAQHIWERPNFPAEEETGEPMNDSLYRRNRQLEDRLNIKIENIAFADRGAVSQNVNKSVKSDDLAYDMVITSMNDGINILAPGGSLYDLNSLNYMQLEKPWWSKSLYENMQVNGKIFYTTGSLSPCFYYAPVVCVYNKNKAADLDMGDINRLVLDNKWTADKFAELIKDQNKDLDGDGAIRRNDFFGYIQDSCGILLFTGFGGKMTVKDDETIFRLNLEDEKVLTIINKCAQILSDKTSVYKSDSGADGHVFVEGRALFSTVTIAWVVGYYRAMEDDYGVIPMPKLDSSQTEYISYGNTWLPNGIAVPVYCDNPERTGLIMETMAALSYDMVRPAIYDNIIQQKAARDEESQIMLDLIFSSVYFDLNVIHNFGGSYELVGNCSNGTKDDFVSGYAKIKDKAEADLNKLIDSYLESK